VRAAVPAAVLCSAVLLSGCAADARGELRKQVADVTQAANAGDADGVRREVDDLDGALDDAVRSGELSSAEAATIASIAASVRERAALLEDAEPAPAPQESEPTPSPASTTRSPSPEPTEDDSVEPSPEPTQDEPEPDEDEDEPGDVVPTDLPAAAEVGPEG
jgi:hypothetical protein